MPNLTAGQSANVVLMPGQRVVFDGELTWSGAGSLGGQVRRDLGTQESIGPFPAETLLRVTAERATSYSVSGMDGVVRPIAPAGLGRWAQGLDAMQRGVRDAKIALIGDSTFAGAYAYGPVWAGAGLGTPAAQLAPMLMNRYGLTLANSTFGNGGSGLTSTYDARIAVSTPNWNAFTPNWLGGNCYRNDTNEVSTLTFTPQSTFDEVTVHYLASPGGATFAVQADGVQLGATQTTNDGAVRRLSISRTITSPARTISIVRQAGAGACPIFGIICSNSQRRGVQVFQWGDSGTTSGSWIDNTTPLYSKPEGITAMAPDLVVINLGINDVQASTVIATYVSNMLSLVNTCRAAGADVLIVTPSPINTAAVTTQDNYYTELRNFALNQGCPIADVYARMGSFASASALGLFAPTNDPIHPGFTGYTLEARAIADVLA